MAARSVIARTYYNTSDYEAARDILEADFGQGPQVAGLLTGSLLWAAVLSALGNSPAVIMDRARALLVAGERLAEANPEDAEGILAATQERYSTMRSMVFALAGEYGSRRTRRTARLPRPIRSRSPANHLEAAFRLALESERLLVQGKPPALSRPRPKPWTAAGAEHDELYFLSDFLVVRAAAAVIHGGDWEAAETLLAGFGAAFRTQPDLLRRWSPRGARHHPAVPGQSRRVHWTRSAPRWNRCGSRIPSSSSP